MARRIEPTAETLSGIDIFRALDAEQRTEIACLCHGNHYPPDQQILSHNDASRDVYFIVSGRVRVTTYSAGGKQVTFRDQSAGETFGELSAIDGQPRSAHVYALEDSVVLSMSPENFWSILDRYPPVAATIMKRLTLLVRLLSERVIEFGTMPVKSRIYTELLRLAKHAMTGDNSAEIAPAPTHADLASRVGTHREAVTRELNRLRRTGLIVRERGKLIVSDVAELQTLIDPERQS